MTRPAVVAAFVLCFALASPRLPGADGPSSFYGRKISAIYFEPANQPLTRDQLGLSISIRPGDVLEEIALSKAIERLWATGRYSDIVVHAANQGEGVELTFRTELAYFVSRVTVEGVPEPPNPAQSSNSTKLGLGEPFDEALLPKATAALEELLRNNGFYTAKVRHETEARNNTEEMDVRFLVEPGQRAKFTRPVFDGNLAMPEKKLIRLSNWQRWFGLRGWKEDNAARMQNGLDRIRDAYLKRDHLQATVSMKSIDYDAAANTVRPVLAIEAGPRIFVRAEGAKVRRGEMRRRIPIYQERTVDRELLLEGQHNLERFFEAQGYFDADVGYSVSDATTTGEQTIRYTVKRGPRFRLVHVEISGNRYFDTNTVRERMSIIPARKPRYPRGVYSQELLDQDLAVITDLYHTNGFRDAQVKAKVERNWNSKATDIGVKLEITEGGQAFVTDVDLTGVDLRLLDEIHGLLASSPGQPFAISTVAADRDTVLNWYFNNGYPEATFDATVVPGGDPGRIKLKYAVVEGRRNFVRDILVSGLKATKPDLVTNRLAVAAGQPLSQSSIVETQRRLYDLGIFAKVDVAVQNPEGRERNKYVLLQVEEAKKYSLNLGFGAEFGRIGGGGNTFDSPAGSSGFSPRGLIGLTRSNMFGLAHTANLTLRVSSIQQRLLASYLAPQFRGNENFNLTFSSLVDRSRDVRTYTSNRMESSVQMGQRVRRGVDIQYRTTARFVFIDKSSLKIDPTLIPIYSQPVKTIVVSGSIIQDRRDEPLDSKRGYYNTLDVGYAPSFAQTSTNYFRLVARNSTYHPLRREFTFARNTSFGWLHNLKTDPIPLPENFYAGGSSTHRGFPDNQAGPRDLVTGFPVGGAAFLFFQHELRFPLIGTTVGAVLFHDMGNVFTTFNDISFRYRQRDQKDFDYMTQAAGLGFRVKTPVGPIRMDFAFSPNSPRFVGFVGTRDELISGTGQYNVPQRVSRFQWHFSIGQAF